ncbi:hypothetical protein I2F27_04200 [Acinetobacter sp. B5B]|uniref:hypothetical protein n=1 Tax=Acinetobacter baretiae TaxID=2605383 RepID=UPI0018C307F7|nr:hypothetical protein [Acinetobacter baretiae]MBF7682534.1 hypothetical protein [Acinetobacter baretiae]MBF7685198.1 hypothetical protein [Acinetobacter baretiae]
MKKVFLFGLVALSLVGCGQKKVMTDKEAWEGFCKSAKGAAFNIMTDRQQDITKDAALEHVKKVEQVHAQKYLTGLIEEAYQIPIYAQMQQKEQAMDDFSKNRYEQCLTQTP